jgi:hypothetical protein
MISRSCLPEKITLRVVVLGLDTLAAQARIDPQAFSLIPNTPATFTPYHPGTVK